ncbi:hypothetical protein [Paenibacillus sp. SYP-B4298]|uniref:hypothetical protein n=1 Tax=Paenibacillus sp. SYP-B4298 TaxID=2996034 RepID=UPI0022DD0F7B|nr:hypothetical protein [Paenibacillus sp. SYP-B4298]
MLSDLERKVLRICYNFKAGRRRPPSIRELCTKTGKQEGQIRFILQQLATKQFIEWQPDRHNELRVVQPWEFNFNKRS